METKKINVEFEEVKVAKIMLDLVNLDNYMDKFLALKNHQRHTDEILSVIGFDDSNSVRVVILLDEYENETEQIQQCKDFVEQFGKIESLRIGTAWIINDTYMDGVTSELGYGDWYVYGKKFY